MDLASRVPAVVAVLAAGIIYGTDVLGALVMRPTWRKVDDRAMALVNGHMHYYGDRRFPIPGVLSVVATVLAVGASAVSGRRPATTALVVWLVIYRRVNAPINRELTAAAREGRVPAKRAGAAEPLGQRDCRACRTAGDRGRRAVRGPGAALSRPDAEGATPADSHGCFCVAQATESHPLVWAGRLSV